MPRKKGTLAKVTAMATGVSETVKNVGEIVEGITGTVSEVVQAINQKKDTPPGKKVVRKPQPTAAARAKPQPPTRKAPTGTKARASRKKITKR